MWGKRLCKGRVTQRQLSISGWADRTKQSEPGMWGLWVICPQPPQDIPGASVLTFEDLK